MDASPLDSASLTRCNAPWTGQRDAKTRHRSGSLHAFEFSLHWYLVGVTWTWLARWMSSAGHCF